MKQLSIIIPHYNSASLLWKLIESIPENPEIEIIVVDDMSNKDEELLGKIEEELREMKHIFTRNNTTKKGAGVCRNIGLKLATGKWVLFADADDFFVEHAFETINSCLNYQEDIIYFSPTSMYLDSKEKADRHLEYEKYIINYLNENSHSSELFLRYKFLIPTSKLIRKELIDKYNIIYDETLVSNDVMFSCKTALYAKKIRGVMKTIYCITKSKGTLTTQKNKVLFEIRAKVLVDRYKFLEANLSREDFETLELSGKAYVAKAILDGYGFLEALKIFFFFKRNSVKLFTIKTLKRDIGEFVSKIRFKKKDMMNQI